MAFVYALWVLAAVALLGLWVDWRAFRLIDVRRFVFSAIGLKAAVALMFLVWWIALRLRLFDDWGDLATLAGIMVISVPLLGVAVICDLVAIRALRRDR